jgi:hypothetical protein
MKGFETINQIEFLGLERITKEYYEHFSMLDVKSLITDDEFIKLSFVNSPLEIQYDLRLREIQYQMQDGKFINIYSRRSKVVPECCDDFYIDFFDFSNQFVEVIGDEKIYRFNYDFEVERDLAEVDEGGIVIGSYYEYLIDEVKITSVDREQDNNNFEMVNFILKPDQKKLLLEKIKNQLYNFYNEIN